MSPQVSSAVAFEFPDPPAATTMPFSVQAAQALWVAARRTDLMHGYKYPRWLIAVGALAWVTTVYLGYMSLTELGQLF